MSNYSSDFFKLHPPINEFFEEHGERVTYPKGHYITHQSDESQYMNLLIDGVVDITHVFPNGTVRIVGYILPNMVFAQAGSMWGFSDGHITSIAQTPVRLLRVPRGMYLAQLEKNAAFSAANAEMLFHNQIALMSRVIIHGAKGIEAQCLQWIWFMVRFYGKHTGDICEIVIPVTQSTIADMLFVTRASVNPVLRKLTNEGLIELKKHTLRILSIKKLKAAL